MRHGRFPMSGIAGVLAVRRPGRDPGTTSSASPIRCVNTGRIAPRSSPARAIGLVHVLMRMTPEDQFDRQPWQGESGALITADIRLDNRDDVLARIGVAPPAAATWSDSRVLLAAWEKFGDDIWPILRGPFAVAIWDPRVRALTLARDHLGLNVTMWHRNAQFFAFATMPNGLFALRRRAARIERRKTRRFPRAQSRRPSNNHLPQCLSRASRRMSCG